MYTRENKAIGNELESHWLFPIMLTEVKLKYFRFPKYKIVIIE